MPRERNLLIALYHNQRTLHARISTILIYCQSRIISRSKVNFVRAVKRVKQRKHAPILFTAMSFVSKERLRLLSQPRQIEVKLRRLKAKTIFTSRINGTAARSNHC